MGGRGLHLILCGALVMALSVTVAAQTSPCSTAAPCVPGGGSLTTDCIFEWRLTPVPPLAGNGLPGRKAVCYEGDPLCDADLDITNHRCELPLTLCINNGDARLPACAPTSVSSFQVRKPSAGSSADAADVANLAALENEANQGFGVTVVRDGAVFLPGTPNVAVDRCGNTLLIEVPLRQRHSGRVSKGRKTFSVASMTADDRRDSDSLKLECRPSTCGNGTVESHEDCDDGNRLNGDGCDQGCRLEPPTPTPTTTRTPANSATATATGTATVTATGSATATPTRTPTPPPATATASASATATATASATSSASATRTASATATATASETPTPTPTPTATPPPIQLSISAYRPQSDSYGGPFQRRLVPSSQNVTPGVGVRINGDDDNNNGLSDVFDSPISGENDLVELTLQANPIAPPPGYEYVLQRGNADIRIWDTADKGFALLGANDAVTLTFSGATRTVWVERLGAGDTLLELLARPVGGGAAVATSDVRLVAFTSVVIALGGENQSPSDPPDPNHGIFNVALTLYDLGYDVHMYDEDDVNSSGAGPAYNEVTGAVLRRGIGIVSIFGYSHGGGSTHDLAERLDANRASLGTFSIPYTAYIDGIGNSSDIDITSETRLPPSTAYHVNYYQRNDLFLRGNSVAGANVNVNVTSTPWGADLVHGSVDDHPNVRDGILQPLLAHVPR